MERQKSLTTPASHPKPEITATHKWLINIIILFHVVGIIGLSIPYTRNWFIAVVPFHLLLMLGVVAAGHYRFNSKFLAFFTTIFLTGYFIEWLGVYTGWVFGTYTYGNTLGTKVFDIPLLIGVNWFLLIYSTGVTMRLSGIKNNDLRALIGAFLLTVLDWLIEPVAIHFDYWHWQYERIPFTNYICWFLLSFAMLILFERFKFKKQSGVAVVFLLIQFIFFIALRLI